MRRLQTASPRIDSQVRLSDTWNLLRSDACPDWVHQALSMVSDMQAIFDCMSAAVETGPLDNSVYQRITDAIQESTDYDTVSLSFFDAKALGFRMVAIGDLPQEWQDEVRGNDMLIPDGGPTSEHYLNSVEPFIVYDFDNDPSSAQPTARSGIYASAMFPLRITSELTASLAIGSRAHVTWHDEEIAWMKAIARHCAFLLRVVEAYRGSERKVDVELERIYGVLKRNSDWLRRELFPEGKPKPAPPLVPSSVDALSRRESEVLDLVVLGKTNAEIADELCLSLSTVKKHVHAILEKLDVSNRSQAAYYVSKRASF